MTDLELDKLLQVIPRPVRKVDQWRIILSGDAYDAPEIRRFHLQGVATWIKGEENKLTSSPIVGVEELNGKEVVLTRSGSRYQLGKPEDERAHG